MYRYVTISFKKLMNDSICNICFVKLLIRFILFPIYISSLSRSKYYKKENKKTMSGADPAFDSCDTVYHILQVDFSKLHNHIVPYLFFPSEIQSQRFIVSSNKKSLINWKSIGRLSVFIIFHPIETGGSFE